MSEPGREAWWICPKCGVVIGFVDDENNLVLWSYARGPVAVRWGEVLCSCGHVIRWHPAMIPRTLDSDGVPVV